MNNYNFELIEYNNFQSARIFITSIQYSNFHWHPEYEFIFVLYYAMRFLYTVP